jgi:hypothetical protein
MSKPRVARLPVPEESRGFQAEFDPPVLRFLRRRYTQRGMNHRGGDPVIDRIGNPGDPWAG